MDLYDYDTTQVFLKPKTESVYIVETPTFMTELDLPIDHVLKIVPNIMQEEDNGSWETYNVINFDGTIVFMLKRPKARVLDPRNIMGAGGTRLLAG